MAREPGSARLIAIIQAPWFEKLKMLWRALCPPPQAFLSTNIYADMSSRGRLVNNVKRWMRFLRLLPRILNDLTSSSQAESRVNEREKVVERVSSCLRKLPFNRSRL